MSYKEVEMIYIGSDHAGFKLKQVMKSFLEKLGVSYIDLGALKFNKNDDYPLYAFKVAKAAARTKSFGILFCGSSHGMCIAANKVKGVRAVALNNVSDAILTRTHNDANVLCLSGWKLNRKLAEKIIKTFLMTRFSNEERHKRRINLIKKYEN